MTAVRYRLGDTGPAISEIRTKLTLLRLLDDTAPGPDVFDEDVDRAIRQFQQERGLTVTGVVDATTYRVLDEARWRLGDRLLSYVVANPQVGDDVMALQRRLCELGFDVGQVDGVFGSRTGDAVRELQRNVGLNPDGTCGPSTFKALGRLAPLVTGGRPDSLRASELLRRQGKRLPGKVVVIDPGHGGHDVGNTGYGLEEATVVEDLAARIEGRLAATGVEAYLTRGPGSDVELDERGRAKFANETGANLMVSLHVDAHPNPEASGVATFYYGGDRPGTTSAIGEQFAGLIQREIVARTDLVDCRTHAKTWDLLRHTTMAAVRVELGYITNERDAARLSDPEFRDVIAEAIVVAVQRVYLPSGEDAPTGVLHLRDLAQA
ncbi:N-acetylmuramoyl-L-alanine amidase [Phytoactinopolyspora halotolerans]|uniref:N-acetylmuramoyl-L-alanine amidase n=1 Tax=Phytoactinopolyspora halotolerans TaxID=1981512 RepID=A0A6L9S2A1_9ACTN|nr:N-acetylmuramoyl-L-alanine amidase [Phytoactinopolyspora halotolerans]NED98691.1 N-acetylmuramoyl-L-alanine amidase [Phytoactinopolyspora halotolerans]